jgi:HPt (histidine-containing phosphotransfer) domain-containing protein
LQSEATAESAETVFNLEALRARCCGREELVRQVARLFLSECPRYLDRMRAALTSGEATGLQTAAHALKGAVGNLGAGTSFVAVKRLEEQARGGNLAAAGVTFDELVTELDRLRPALRGLLANQHVNNGSTARGGA